MQSYKIYKTIDSCPLWNFAKCLETNDYRYLLILDYYDDLPEVEVNKDIFDKIMLDFLGSTDKNKIDTYVKDLYHINTLRNEIITISNCINVLYFKKDAEIVDILSKYLKKYWPNFIFDNLNPIESLTISLKNSEILAQKLALKNTSFERKYNKEEKSDTDLIEVLTIIQNHYKYRLNPKEITLREFITIKANFEKELKNGGKTRSRRT